MPTAGMTIGDVGRNRQLKMYLDQRTLNNSGAPQKTLRRLYYF